MDRSPWPADWTVRRARDAYLAENGFSLEGYDAPWTEASFFGIRFRVPNTARHRWALVLHDLHHVATGYGTDLTGEGEISAFELRGGLRALGPYVGTIVLLGAATGLALAPRRTLAAWRAAARTRTLFVPRAVAVDNALLDRTVGELRDALALPREGLAREPRRLHTYAPAPHAAAS